MFPAFLAQRRFSNAAIFAFSMIAMLASGAAYAAAATDYSGTYANEKVTLVLRADDTGARYSGTITVGGNTYRCIASIDSKGFHGAFQANDTPFAITIEPQADGSVVLASGESRYALKRQAAAAPGTNPTIPGTNPAAPGIPAFFKPGLRMTWRSGKSTREGASLVPDPNGWIIKNGKRFTIAENVGVGLEGIRQVTLQHVAADAVLGEVRNFSVIANLQGKFLTSAGFDIAAGNGTAVGDYWVNPAVLAQLQQGREEDGQTTYKRRYAIEGKEFNAITIYRFGQIGYSSLTYDLDTGVLLFLIRTSATPDFVVQTPQGGYRFNGSIDIERLNFANVRQINFAGANETVPQWAARGVQLEYKGSYRLDIKQDPGLPALPPTPGFATQISFTIQGGTKTAIVANWATVTQVDRGGIADQHQGARCFGNHMYLGALWMSPKVIEKFQANQVLDEDRMTGFRTVFAGVRGNVAVIVEQGPIESTESYYDMQSGSLVGWKSSSQSLPGAVRTNELQLVQPQR